MWCGDLCIPLSRQTLSLQRLGVNLYRVSFTKVARFDVAKAVDTNTGANTGADTGGSCPYGCLLKLLEVSNTSPLTLEYWKLIILH
jgi:hypothetical protein